MLEKKHRVCRNGETMMTSASHKNAVLRRGLGLLALYLYFSGWAFALPKEASVPAVNAALGPCSVAFTVGQNVNQPIYNAQISVRIAYGFMGMKKMDLQIGTNSQGKARFEGLPNKVHNPPLTFVVKHEGRTKSVEYWPRVRCHAQYSVIMGPG